jgi:class 3 adenylate cyclase/tetratricopeptide (TPR) repeat protein
MAAAEEGRPRVVLIAGEAGAGKTRLLEEVLDEARAAGTRVLEGACLPLGDDGPPYAAVVGLLRSLGRMVEPAALPALLGPGRADLARLVPAFADRASGTPADLATASVSDATAQVRLFELVAGVVERMARSAPLIVAVEDVHWADRSSRDLVDFLVRGLRAERLVLVMTLRTDGLEGNDPVRAWVAELTRLPHVERIDLGPLDRAAVAELVAGVLGSPVDGSFVDLVIERANGNPFLTTELAAVGSQPPRAGRGPAGETGDSMPDRLREILLARLSGIDDRTRVVLRAASAAGRRIDDSLLVDALELPEPELLGSLHEAVDRGLLIRAQDDASGEDVGPAFAFRHALLREVIYDELFPRERARLHAAFATALAERQARDPGSVAPSELAWHWDAAGELSHALAAHVDAGGQAARVYAWPEARRHVERALSLWPRVPDADEVAGCDRAAILERAADVASMLGDYGAALAYAREAIDLIDETAAPARAGSLQEHLRWQLWEAGDQDAAAAAVAEGLRLIPDAPPSNDRARVLAHAAGLEMFAGRPREALTGARAAIKVARAASALPEEALALGVAGWATSMLGHVDEGVDLFRQGMVIAEMLGSVEGLALGYDNLASLLDRVGRTEEALAVAVEGREAVARYGLSRTFGGSLRALEARMLYHLGRWDEAEQTLRDGLAIGPVPSARLDLLIEATRLASARGQVAEAHDALAQAREIAGSVRSVDRTPALIQARVEAAAWTDAIEDGRAAIDEALSIPTVGRLPDPALAWVGALGLRLEGDAAEAARARRDAVDAALAEQRASRIVDWLRGWLPTADPARQEARARALDPRAAAIVTQLRAEEGRLLGRSDAAAWASVAETWSGLGRPFPAALARYRQGAATLATGDRAGARAALADAAATARRLGAVPLQQSVDRLARLARIDVEASAERSASDVGPSDPGPAEAIGLTPREREVLRLLAAGWSNPEIGDALGISRKTASVHVSNLLGKLGVENRVEAAVVATRLGLDDDLSTGLERDPSERVRRAFLFTDIVGSTPLLEAIGDGAWGELRRWHDATLRSLFARHGGEEVHHAGDGFFVAFATAASAARCAVEIQRALAAHRRTAGFAPAVRIGFHVGPAERDESGYAGAAVHVAARIAARAEGGQILASSDSVREARVSPTGRPTEVHLKGVAEPVSVAELAW